MLVQVQYRLVCTTKWDEKVYTANKANRYTVKLNKLWKGSVTRKVVRFIMWNNALGQTKITLYWNAMINLHILTNCFQIMHLSVPDPLKKI